MTLQRLFQGLGGKLCAKHGNSGQEGHDKECQIAVFLNPEDIQADEKQAGSPARHMADPAQMVRFEQDRQMDEEEYKNGKTDHGVILS